jgi:hypothetical protein
MGKNKEREKKKKKKKKEKRKTIKGKKNSPFTSGIQSLSLFTRS